MPMHITHRLATFTRLKFALLVLALGLAGPASVAAQVKGAWHPMVFSMMESWISDVASPVVAEINLDAVPLTVVIVNYVEQADATAIGQLVVHEVH